MRRKCEVDGCEKEVHGYGLCRAHLHRKNRHGDPGEAAPRRAPNGAGAVDNGYRRLRIGGVKQREHILVAEKALGKPLPKGAVVHHVNGDRTDNRPENLVICPNKGYHSLIHWRERALDTYGDANYRKHSPRKKKEAA